MATKRCPNCNSRRIKHLPEPPVSEVAMNAANRGKHGAIAGTPFGLWGKVIGAIAGALYGIVEGTPDNRECKSCKTTWFEGSS